MVCAAGGGALGHHDGEAELPGGAPRRLRGRRRATGVRSGALPLPARCERSRAPAWGRSAQSALAHSSALFLVPSAFVGKRSERRRQGSSPEGRRPRKRASWSRSGQSPARRNRARRPVAGRAAAQTRRPGILQDRKTPGSRNDHAYMPIHEEREGGNRKDFCREIRSAGAARQATVRERGRRRRRRRAEGGPGRRERSERGCCCCSGGMKRADRRETTNGSLAARENAGRGLRCHGVPPLVVDGSAGGRWCQEKSGCVSSARLTVSPIVVPKGTMWAPRGSSVM